MTVEAPEVVPFEFYEDSEITLAVDWGELRGGEVNCGILRLHPMAKSRSAEFYAIELESFVGSLEIAFWSQQQLTGRLAMSVRRRKLANDDDLRAMERYWAASNLPSEASVRRKVFAEGGLAPGAASPAQWTAMTRRLLKPIQSASRSIRKRPRMALTPGIRDVSHVQLRKPSPGAVMGILNGKKFVRSARPAWEVDSGARAMVSGDAGRLLFMMRRVRAELEEGESLDEEIFRGFDGASKGLASLLSAANTRTRTPVRQSVLHDSRYRLLHRAALYSRRQATTTPSGLPTFRPSTAMLYQEWCALAVAEELAPSTELDRVRTELARSGSRTILLRPGPRLTLSLQHEIALPSGTHRPDLLLTVEDSNRVVILDAKYQAESYRLRRPPPEALNALHRYRDVFKLEHPGTHSKEIWTAILFPSPAETDEDWHQGGLLESALDPRFRIGAVPLSPSLRQPLHQFFEKLGIAV